MTGSPFAARFASFCAAQYGVEDPAALPDRQRLEAEDAFMAGASAGFYTGFGATDAEALAANAELQRFGKRIVKRYQAAGLDTGARRS